MQKSTNPETSLGPHAIPTNDACCLGQITAGSVTRRDRSKEIFSPQSVSVSASTFQRTDWPPTGSADCASSNPILTGCPSTRRSELQGCSPAATGLPRKQLLLRAVQFPASIAVLCRFPSDSSVKGMGVFRCHRLFDGLGLRHIIRVRESLPRTNKNVPATVTESPTRGSRLVKNLAFWSRRRHVTLCLKVSPGD